MNFSTLSDLLIQHGLVDAAALRDPDGYDNYATANRVAALARQIDMPSQLADAIPTGAPCPTNSEEWWTTIAFLMSAKMKQAGVSSFSIRLTPRGTYAFEVAPSTTAPVDTHLDTLRDAQTSLNQRKPAQAAGSGAAITV